MRIAAAAWRLAGWLNPACGTGNFLIEVLQRKLDVVTRRYARNSIDWERYALVAVANVYGIDLLWDNVDECQKRLYAVFAREYVHMFKGLCDKELERSIRHVLRKNIQCGDALTMTTLDGHPIIFSEWSLMELKVKRRDFTFDELLEANRSGQISIFQAAMAYDQDAQGFIPNPLKEYPLIHYRRVFEYE